MKILVVSATFNEIKALVDRLELIERKDDFLSRYKLDINKEVRCACDGHWYCIHSISIRQVSCYE